MNLTWEDLEHSVPASLVKEARELAAELLYAVVPPKTVTIFSYHCDDQVHYLRDFLFREPFAMQRPLRFVYKQLRAKSDVVWTPEEIPPYSILLIKTEEQTWDSFQSLFSALGPTTLVIGHKDEYCEFSPSGLASSVPYYRGYWDAGLIESSRTLWFPLGVRKVFPRVFPHEILPAHKRAFTFNYIASLSTSPSRKQLAEIVADMEPPYFVHTIEEWDGNFEGYLDPHEYKYKLLQSIFTLSPR